ncbi:MAG TPA: PadR family transcriptional regulator [Candidatus Korarchaeota archaeon]|nr:PadR family transcriptional regulator [Candidatus Korarchaeota archaeon]
MTHKTFVLGKKLSPIELLILLQLKRKPMYGYEIIKELKKVFEGVWEPKTGTIYPALRRLETRGLIKTELIDDREHYYLTERGEKVLLENLEFVERSLHFAEKYYQWVSWHLPPPVKEKMLRRVVEGEPPILFWPFSLMHFIRELEDKKAKLEMLKMIRNAIKKKLDYIDSKIAELEKEV